MNACEWPDQVWLGMTRGEWPVVAFVSESTAAKWAADFDGAERYVRGPIALPSHVAEKSPVYLPASYTLEERSTKPTGQDDPAIPDDASRLVAKVRAARASLDTQPSDQWVTAPDGEQFRVGECQGHAGCPVEKHEHGCFADAGNCDHPEDHQPSERHPVADVDPSMVYRPSTQPSEQEFLSHYAADVTVPQPSERGSS